LLYQSTGQNSLTALSSLLSTALQDGPNGFTNAYTSGSIKGWTVGNTLTAGGGADQMFAILTDVNSGAGSVGLSLARNITAGVVTGQLASFAQVTGLVGPFDFFVVCTPFRLVINIYDHGQTKYFTLFACCLDWRVVYTTVSGAGADPTHLINLKNNSQAVGKLGSPASYRILYAGEIGLNNVFDQLVNFNYVDIMTDIAVVQNAIGVSLTSAGISASDRLFGILHGAALSNNRILFNLDRGQDSSGGFWRVFKDTDSSDGIFVREI